MASIAPFLCFKRVFFPCNCVTQLRQYTTFMAQNKKAGFFHSSNHHHNNYHSNNNDTENNSNKSCIWKSTRNYTVLLGDSFTEHSTRHTLPLVMKRWLSSFDGNGFIHLRGLGLEQFEKLVLKAERKYKGREEEMKQQFEARLDESTADILVADALTYIYVSGTQNTKNFSRILQRLREQQSQEELLLGLINTVRAHQPLEVSAIKKCYLLNDVDVAVDIIDNMNGEFGYATCLKLTMDLLYRNEQWEKIVDIAVRVVDAGLLNKALPWFYDMSILAAYRLKSEKGLAQAAKIFDAVEHLPLKRSKLLRLLLAKYCVDQHHVRAAMTLVDQINHGDDLRVINVKVLCHIQIGDVEHARRLLYWYQSKYIVEPKKAVTDTIEEESDENVTPVGAGEHVGENSKVVTAKSSSDKSAEARIRRPESSSDKAAEARIRRPESSSDKSAEARIRRSESERKLLFKDVFHELKRATGKCDDESLVRYSHYLSYNHGKLMCNDTLAYHIIRDLTRLYWDPDGRITKRDGNEGAALIDESFSSERVTEKGTAV